MTDEKVIYVRGVPGLTRDRFKSACAKRRFNMREVCIALYELFAETEQVELVTPSDESKWLQQVIKRVNKNRRIKSASS